MNDIEKKHLEHVYEMQASEAAMKWYGWGTPIGLSIFFWTILGIIVVIKMVFFG